MRRRKGKTGELVERALGATSSSYAGPDFPLLGVEVKTIPLDARGMPRESTFVCSFAVGHADALEWETSPLRAKLSHVLWVPIVGEAVSASVGEPFFWRPNPEQTAILRGDFEELVGLVAIGKVEALSAHLGRAVQVRPKAAHGAVRTCAFDEQGAPLATMPRGFYLRARFTRTLLSPSNQDGCATSSSCASTNGCTTST
jgi:DNA mismatch repair protein MutH